jgi:hypothetical protein
MSVQGYRQCIHVSAREQPTGGMQQICAGLGIVPALRCHHLFANQLHSSIGCTAAVQPGSASVPIPSTSGICPRDPSPPGYSSTAAAAAGTAAAGTAAAAAAAAVEYLPGLSSAGL